MMCESCACSDAFAQARLKPHLKHKQWVWPPLIGVQTKKPPQIDIYKSFMDIERYHGEPTFQENLDCHKILCLRLQKAPKIIFSDPVFVGSGLICLRTASNTTPRSASKSVDAHCKASSSTRTAARRTSRSSLVIAVGGLIFWSWLYLGRLQVGTAPQQFGLKQKPMVNIDDFKVLYLEYYSPTKTGGWMQ